MELGKRKRMPTSRFTDDFIENEEKAMINQAIKVSKMDVKREIVDVPDAPTYYPTREEFVDPIAFIKKIRPEVELYGICKIVPPDDWDVPSIVNFSNPRRFGTKVQPVDKLQQGQPFEDGRRFTLMEYKDMADRFKKDWTDKHYNGNTPTQQQLANDYWDMVETAQKSAEVQYGNDVDTTTFGSCFPLDAEPAVTGGGLDKPDVKAESASRKSKYSRWNLNYLPTDDKSLLKYVNLPINGINVPWLYFGMLFATFCWHNEDNYLYSINYSHYGDVKQWYGVPGSQAEQFERVSKDFLLGLFKESPDIMHHMTTQISPSLLAKNNVPIYKASQERGTFIITLPKSFHCGFSYGFNIGEAVNFAPFDWLPFGGEAEDRYRRYAREPVFSHVRLLFTLLHNKDVLNHKEQQVLNNLVAASVDSEIALRKGFEHLGFKFRAAPPNEFRTISKRSIDYDDKRCCAVCRQVCIFSAMACECNNVKVVCPYHYERLCKCGKDKKFIIAWADNKTLTSMKNEAVSKNSSSSR